MVGEPRKSVPKEDRASLIEITVIVCTRNRAESLNRCLYHHEKVYTTAIWELVIVNNGSTDGTTAVVQHFVNRGILPIIVINEPVPGLSRARNAGLRAAKGEIVCFSDDDCYPDPGFLDAWLNIFRDPAIGFGGGRIELFDPSDANISVKTVQSRSIFPPNRLIVPGALHGASIALRRRVIETIGFFDPELGAGTRLKSAEDTEYLQRASEWGFTGLYSPDPLVLHHHGRKIADLSTLLNGYDRGWGAFYACILARNPRILWRAILEDYQRSPTFSGYAKTLFWRSRRWSPRRVWNMLGGAITFTILQFCRQEKPYGPIPRHIPSFRLRCW